MMMRILNLRCIAAVWAMAAAIVFSTASYASDQSQPRIRVTGEGKVDIAPDMAIMELTVVREAETARMALDENSAAMEDVLAQMKSLGIAASDLQTSNFSIQPRYFYPPPKAAGQRDAPRITGYIVRNSLTVRVRDISAVGTILDKSVSLGVNEGGNIRFGNIDPSAAITQARTRAVKGAIVKAGTLAAAAGVRVGKIIEISEQSFAPRPQNIAQAEMKHASSADSVPVAVGENSYRVVVNVTVAIDQ